MNRDGLTAKSLESKALTQPGQLTYSVLGWECTNCIASPQGKAVQCLCQSVAPNVHNLHVLVLRLTNHVRVDCLLIRPLPPTTHPPTCQPASTREWSDMPYRTAPHGVSDSRV